MYGLDYISFFVLMMFHKKKCIFCLGTKDIAQQRGENTSIQIKEIDNRAANRENCLKFVNGSKFPSLELFDFCATTACL